MQGAGILAGAAIGFFTFVAVTRGLGPEAFGDFTAAMAFLFIPVVIADLGLSTAVLREISAAPERTEPAMRASLPFRALFSAVVVVLAAAVGFALPLNERTTDAILIAAIGSFLTLMTLALLPVLQAELRMHWAVAGSVTGRLVTLGATLGALELGLGFKSMVWAQVIGIAVTFAIHLLAVGRTVSLRPVIDPPYWRALFFGSLAIGLAIGLSQIYFRIDTLLLAMLRSSEEVGLYGAAYKFIELAQFGAAAVSVSLFPPARRLRGAERIRARRDSSRKGSTCSSRGCLRHHPDAPLPVGDHHVHGWSGVRGRGARATAAGPLRPAGGGDRRTLAGASRLRARPRAARDLARRPRLQRRAEPGADPALRVQGGCRRVRPLGSRSPRADRVRGST